MKSIQAIDKAGLCCGCGFCVGLSNDPLSQMEEGKDGYLHPHLNSSNKEQLNTILEVCPGLNLKNSTRLKSKEEKLWGPLQSYYLGYAQDEKVRWNGSSGGGISSLLIYLLESGIVDGVIQTAPSLNNPLKTDTFLSRSKEDILRAAGSRYCPSSPLSKIGNILSDPTLKLAFVGRPCDISAFRKFLMLYPELERRIILLISFFCASTPSYKATDILLDTLKVTNSDVADFWYRGKGWPGDATVINKSGKKFSLSYEDSWGKIFCNHAHFRCKICPDSIGIFSDITFADAWELENNQPAFKDKDGLNVILVRTASGQKILNDAVKNGYIKTLDFDLHKLKLMQPSQESKRILVAARLLALKCVGIRYPQCKGLSVYRNLLLANPFDILHNFLGTLKRKLLANFKSYDS